MFQQPARAAARAGPDQPYYNMFRWGANANLGRIYEAKEGPPRAIAHYTQLEPTMQYHGNLLRARELVWRDPMAPGPDPSRPPRRLPGGRHDAGRQIPHNRLNRRGRHNSKTPIADAGNGPNSRYNKGLGYGWPGDMIRSSASTCPLVSSILAARGGLLRPSASPLPPFWLVPRFPGMSIMPENPPRADRPSPDQGVPSVSGRARSGRQHAGAAAEPVAARMGDAEEDPAIGARRRLGDRDGRQPVPLPLPGRAPFPHPEPAGAVGGRGEPAGAGGAAALRLQRRGPGASGGRRAGPARAARAAGRPEPAAARWPRPGGSCRRSSAEPGVPDPAVRSRVAPLAAVRRAAGAPDLVGLPGPAVGPPGLLPLRPPRRRLRAARAAPGPARPAAVDRAETPRPSPAPACPATPTPSAPATSTPPAASSTPPSRPSTAAWAAL